VQETEGARFVDSLDTSRFAAVFRKGTDPSIDSYSAFFDNRHEKDTGLGDYLRAREVKRLYIMGLATDYCVLWSALDARELGLETFVILDGCRGIDQAPGDIARAIEEMKERGVHVITSDEVEGT
jgi:nicotinamidase/pyrazinamidase